MVALYSLWKNMLTKITLEKNINEKQINVCYFFFIISVSLYYYLGAFKLARTVGVLSK